MFNSPQRRSQREIGQTPQPSRLGVDRGVPETHTAVVPTFENLNAACRLESLPQIGPVHMVVNGVQLGRYGLQHSPVHARVIRNGDSDQAAGFSKVDVPIQAWGDVIKVLHQAETHDDIPWGVLGRTLKLKQVGMNDLGIETALLTSLSRLITPIFEVVDA